MAVNISTIEELQQFYEENDEHKFLMCEPCSVLFNNIKDYKIHITGKKHQKKVKEENEKKKFKAAKEGGTPVEDKPKDKNLFCETCNLQSECYKSHNDHLRGAQHKKNEQKKKAGENIDSVFEDADDDASSTECKICTTNFTSAISKAHHLKGLQHKKNVTKLRFEEEMKGKFTKEETLYKCNECNNYYPDIAAFKTHIVQNNHEKDKIKEAISELVRKFPALVVMKCTQNVDEEDDDEHNLNVGEQIIACKFCRKTFSGIESARQHVYGINHKKKMADIEAKKQLKLIHNNANGTPQTSSTKNELKQNFEKTKVEKEDDFEIV